MASTVKRNLKSLQVYRGKWRDQVFRDHAVSFGSRCIGYALASFATMTATLAKYVETGRVIVFPSQLFLQEQTGASHNTVQRGINELIAKGHLRRVRRGNQHIGSNAYRLLIKGDVR